MYSKYGVLNVVVQPHPNRAYRRLFEAASQVNDGDRIGVRFFGDQFAAISPISETRNGVFSGRIAIWTEIDPESNMIQKSSLRETLLADSGISLPDDVGFNSRIFAFAFREANHRLFVELLNDEDRSISVGRARQAFNAILQHFCPDEFESAEVYVVPRKNAVDQVLSTPGLKKIEIVLDVPNPDDLSEEKQKLLDEVNEMRAKRLKSEITKRAGADSLELTGRYKDLAELAQDTGYVTATGARDGEKIERSTKSYPEEIEAELPENSSRAAYTRDVAENRE
ncbi:DUF4747 family protein [Tateyamaria sp. SN6-1]|uniref:DUF4747 family protein n=1 Tax=Tateyamaria sp. SN6-1 TaxID=3092148 RepID=UPI0039F61543